MNGKVANDSQYPGGITPSSVIPFRSKAAHERADGTAELKWIIPAIIRAWQGGSDDCPATVRFQSESVPEELEHYDGDGWRLLLFDDMFILSMVVGDRWMRVRIKDVDDTG